MQSSPTFLIQTQNLSKVFNKKKFNNNFSLNNINLKISQGETVGLVGHSGCGKSTLGKILIRLIPPSTGTVLYKNHNIFALPNSKFKPFRRDLQMVFQDPFSSFDNLLTVEQILTEGLRIYKICDRKNESEFINNLLNLVNLKLSVKNKHPSELSGGECQRVAIARSLSVNPKFIVFDESTSALDAITEYQIIKTIKDLQSKIGLTYLFISHNIGLVKDVADEIAVMENGKIVEFGKANTIYNNPSHLHTQELVNSFKFGWN